MRRPETRERYFFGAAPRRERLVFRPLRRPFSLAAAVMRGAHPSAVGSSRARVDAAFDVLDDALGERRYLVESSLSLADLSVAVAANMALVPPDERERNRSRPSSAWVEATLPARYHRWL